MTGEIGEFLQRETRLGGTSLKAAALLSALRAQVPEAALSNGQKNPNWIDLLMFPINNGVEFV